MRIKTKIYFMNNTDTRVGWSLKALIKRAVKATLDYEGFCNGCEVSVTFVDNEGIRQLNSEYRGIDRETDVLSFPLTDYVRTEEPAFDEKTVMLGDIVISLEKAAEQAAQFGHSQSREVAFLCVHSMLHLLGYDHETSDADDADMRRRQSEILDGMGLCVKKGENK